MNNLGQSQDTREFPFQGMDQQMLIDAVAWYMGENDGDAEVFKNGSALVTAIGRGKDAARLSSSQVDFLGQALDRHLNDLAEMAVLDPTPSSQGKIDRIKPLAERVEKFKAA